MNLKLIIPVLIFLLLVPVVFAESKPIKTNCTGLQIFDSEAWACKDVDCFLDEDCPQNHICEPTYDDSPWMLITDYQCAEIKSESFLQKIDLNSLVIGAVIGAVVMGIGVLIIVKTDEE